MKPTDLIALIYKHTKQQRMLIPQITRLVKLMYLSELEYYRLNRRRLTDLEWKFYHYGPYPFGLRDLLGEPLIDTSEWKGGKVSKQLMLDEDKFMNVTAEAELEALISEVVKMWGDADLNQLLDYVYFETEPMQTARRGDALDFSAVTPVVRARIRLKIDAQKLRELRKRVADRSKAYAAVRAHIRPLPDLVDNLQIWDSDNPKRFPSGPCAIRVDDLVPNE